ncbi:MAG TPA: hypothetical protein VL463_15640 [Kofleriaceae bacterium]|nr:hypothetical protein [Kofleriaceae bacterium]
MKSTALVVIALAAIATPAAADNLALPGSTLTLELPKAAYQADAQKLQTASGRTIFVAKVQRGECETLFRGLAGQGSVKLGVPVGAPASWADARVEMGASMIYCRSLESFQVLLLSVTTTSPTDDVIRADATPVMEAIDKALDDTRTAGTKPAITLKQTGWSITLPPAWSATTHTDTITDQGNGQVITLGTSDRFTLAGAPAVVIDVEKGSGCAEDLVTLSAVPDVGSGIIVLREPQAPSAWFPIAEQRNVSADERSRGVASVTLYCRDLATTGDDGAHIIVYSDGAHAADIVDMLRALEAAMLSASHIKPTYRESTQDLLGKVQDYRNQLRASLGQGPPPDLGTPPFAIATENVSTYGAAPAPAYTPPPTETAAYTPPAYDSSSSYVPPPSSSSSTSADYHYREPASYDSPRWGLVGGQSQLDPGAMTHTYVVARVTMAPRYLEDYDDSGLVVSAGASAGANGDAFVGDAFAGAGFGFSTSGLSFAVSGVMGVDRVGGGFEPDAGLYVGAHGMMRVGFGPISFEGDGMITASTGVNESRAELRALTHVGGRVVALGGFYQQWNEADQIVGVSLGVTR